MQIGNFDCNGKPVSKSAFYAHGGSVNRAPASFSERMGNLFKVYPKPPHFLVFASRENDVERKPPRLTEIPLVHLSEWPNRDGTYMIRCTIGASRIEENPTYLCSGCPVRRGKCSE